MAKSKCSDQQIIDAISIGKSLGMMAKEFNISKSSLSERVKKLVKLGLVNSVSDNATKTKFDPIIARRFIETEYKSNQYAAEFFNMTESRLCNLLKKHSIIRKPIISEKELIDCVNNKHMMFTEISDMIAARVGDNKDRTSTISAMASKLGLKSVYTIINAVNYDVLPTADIINKYIKGNSIYSIMREYKVSRFVVQEVLKRYDSNIKLRTYEESMENKYESFCAQHIGVLDLQSVEKLTAMADNKMSAFQIAKIFGVSKTTVIRAYIAAGVNRYMPNIQQHLKDAKDDIIKSFTIDKMSLSYIAAQYGVRKARIRRILVDAGVVITDRKPIDIMDRFPLLKDKEWLVNHYINNLESASSVSRLIDDKCTAGHVIRALMRHKVQVRQGDEYIRTSNNHGVKIVKMKNGKLYHCDSLLEVSFIDSPDADGFSRFSDSLKLYNVVYVPDFVNDEDKVIVEVKSEERSINPGDRRSFIKQKYVAEAHGYEFKHWNDGFRDLFVENIDIYYLTDWRLHFKSADECTDWLLSYGFQGCTMEKLEMYVAIRIYNELLEKYNNSPRLLDSRLSCSPMMNLIRSFSPHFFYSRRSGFNELAIADLFGDAGCVTLRNIIKDMWNMVIKSKHINLMSVLHYANRNIDRFRMVSIFKPWVARYVYDKLLPNGGTVIDPCVGWGGRLIGCVGAKIDYIGYDLNDNSVCSVTELGKFLKSNINKFDISKADATIYKYPDADLVFTSPPYDMTELYYGIDYSKHTKTIELFDNWFSQFNCNIALNIPERLTNSAVYAATKYGWKLNDELSMSMITNSFLNGRASKEPILVFQK